MKRLISIAIAAFAMCAAVDVATAEPVQDVIVKKLQLPEGLHVEKVYVPPSMEKLDVKPDDVMVEQVREPREGRPSIRVTVGTRTSYVQVAIRGTEKKQAAEGPTVARGTKVTLIVHRGGLVVRGQATLESAAKVGGDAQVRVPSTKTLVKGTLVSEDTVEVEP